MDIKCYCGHTDRCDCEPEIEVMKSQELLFNGNTIKIKFEEWHYQCGDGCCDSYGTYLYLNGKKLEHPNPEIHDNGYLGEDVQTALEAVLKELGYKVEFDYGA